LAVGKEVAGNLIYNLNVSPPLVPWQTRTYIIVRRSCPIPLFHSFAPFFSSLRFFFASKKVRAVVTVVVLSVYLISFPRAAEGLIKLKGTESTYGSATTPRTFRKNKVGNVFVMERIANMLQNALYRPIGNFVLLRITWQRSIDGRGVVVVVVVVDGLGGLKISANRSKTRRRISSGHFTIRAQITFEISFVHEAFGSRI
jgi:hypothetical protein